MVVWKSLKEVVNPKLAGLCHLRSRFCKDRLRGSLRRLRQINSTRAIITKVIPDGPPNLNAGVFKPSSRRNHEDWPSILKGFLEAFYNIMFSTFIWPYNFLPG